MTETHERRQCSVCGTFWPHCPDTCPLCGMETFRYTMEVE